MCDEQLLKTLDAIEERMQSANKAHWRDIQVYKSKDVPLRIKCRRLVDHVYSVFSFGSENWFWTIQTLDLDNDGAYSASKERWMRRG